MAYVAVPTTNPLLISPFSDVDESTYGEVPTAKDLELRVGNATPGAGTLVELRSSTAYICENERVGERLDALTATAGYTITAGSLALVATNPTGYGGSSLQLSPGSMANGAQVLAYRALTAAEGARLLSEYSGGTLVRVWARLSVLISGISLRIRFEKLGSWSADYLMGTLTASYAEGSLAKQSPTATSGTPWSSAPDRLNIMVINGNGASQSPVVLVRDLRIGTVRTDATSPTGHFAYESTYDWRVRYQDAAATWGAWATWATVKPSQPPTVGLTSPVPIALDQFGRTATDSWGSADTGGAYTLSGTAADFDVAAGVGTIVAAASSTHSARLASVSARDLDVVVQVKADKLGTGEAWWVGLLTRDNGTSTYYRAMLWCPIGGVSPALSITPVVAGVAGADVGSYGSGALANIVAGTDYLLRVRVTGASPTRVQARWWPASTTEPSTWQVDGYDSTSGLQVAGQLRFTATVNAISNGPVTFTVDKLVAVPTTSDATPTLTSTYVSPGGKTKASSTWDVYEVSAAGALSLLLSATVAGTAVTYDVPAGMLYTGRRYAWRVTHVDTDGLATTSPLVIASTWSGGHLSTAFEVPPTPTGFTATPDPIGGTVELAWDASTMAGTDFVRWNVYRANDPGGDYELAATISSQATTSWSDPDAVLSPVSVSYRLTQASGAADVGESAEATADALLTTVTPGSSVLAAPELGELYELEMLTADPASWVVPTTEYQPLGRSTPVVEEGTPQEARGSFTFLLPPERWNVLTALRRLRGPQAGRIIYKNRYGYVGTVRLTSIDVVRQRGGMQECTATYVEV